MSFSPHDYLRHILDEADFLIRTSRGLSAEEFLASETLKRAFVRSLEIIGEATRQLPATFREAHPQMEWRPMARMGDHLVHGYFGVDYELVWEVVQTQIPQLRRTLEAILPD